MAKTKQSRVQLGGLETAEELRMAQLEALKAAIEKWAKRHKAWFDSGWHVPHEHKSYRPSRGDILYMWSEDGVIDLVEMHHEREFLELLDAHGFYYEAEDHVTLSFYPQDESVMDEFHRIRLWQWVRDLASKRLYDIHSEVFEHFAKAPETLACLSWRQYEEVLDAIFRNQGYRTELGTGGNDGGVDIRLYQSETIPELVTLVQAKRHRNRPIKQDAVASLFGVAVEQRASKGIFATTSRFQPKAKLFAKSVEARVDLPTIELIDSQRVGEWCAHIANDLNRFFAGDPASIPPILNRPTTPLTGRIVVATGGYNITANTFAIVEADFPSEVVLRVIGSEKVSGDGQRGTEIPSENARVFWRGDPRFVAFKNAREGGGIYFWDGRSLFVVGRHRSIFRPL